MKKFLLFSALLFLVGVTSAAIYKWVDEEGRVHYSDTPAPDKPAEKLPVEAVPKKDETYRSRQEFRKLLEEQVEREQQREQQAEEKKQAAIKKAYRKKLSALQLEFGGHWIEGIDLERQCQQKYRLGCDDLLNWKQREYRKCRQAHGSDQDCEDDDYLSRFKPLTIEEQRSRGIHHRSRQLRLYKR